MHRRRGLVFIVMSLLFFELTWWMWRDPPMIDQDCLYRLHGEAAAWSGIIYITKTSDCAPLAPGMQDLVGLPAEPRKVFALDFFLSGILFLILGIRDVRRKEPAHSS